MFFLVKKKKGNENYGFIQEEQNEIKYTRI